MGCDTICDLPDALLTQILLNLETKESVRTSVLSTRWRNLWFSVPGLDLHTYQFGCAEILVRFMDTFMKFNHGSHLQSFKIWYGNNYYHNSDRVMELINILVDRGIQRLNVSISPHIRDAFICQNIYKSKTLVSLKLVNVELKNPGFVVSLPCLKIMKLRQVCYGKDGPLILEKLISGCPLLEDLKLIRPFYILNERDVLLFLRVSSQTLKRCCLMFALNKGDTDFTVEIDAPPLEYLKLSEGKSDSIVAKNLSSLFMIDCDFNYGSPFQPEDLRKRYIFCDFLTGISSVKRMNICETTLKVLNSYSKLGPIPKFHNLYHLQAPFYSSSSSFLLFPALFECCPNLKILSLLDFRDSKEPDHIDFTNVPQCLISTLEYVEIKKRIRATDVIRIIKLVNYFLENSAVLKKLTLRLKDHCITTQELERYKKLLTSTKLSPTCQVVIE